MATRKRTDWHKLIQDILDEHLEVMSGKTVVERDRESSTHFRVDYFCRCSDEPPAGRAATVAGIRPFDHLRGTNVIEYKSIHETLTDRAYRGYLGETLLLESRLEARGDMTLTIVLTRVPRGILSQEIYGFREITPWKYQTTVLGDLEVTILIQRMTRGIAGGEPFAYLQALEGDPQYRKETWRGILAQDLERPDPLKDVIMKLSREDFMSIADEFRREGERRGLRRGEQKGLIKGEKQGMHKELSRVLMAIVTSRPELEARYATAIANATSLAELRKLETSIMRDFTG